MAEACGQAKESLTICMQFATDITFYSIPSVLRNAVGGNAGFVLLSKVFAETSRRIYSAVRQACCPDLGDPVPLFQRLERVTKLIGGSSYRAEALVERLPDGRTRLRFRGLEHLSNDIVTAAPIVGIIMGMIEAVGGKAVAVTPGRKLDHTPGDAYKVVVERLEGDELDLLVIPPGA